MTADVCIAFRGDGAERSRNWSYLRPLWVELGWPLYVADTPGRTFRGPAARNAAAAKGTGDVVFLADADVLVDPAAAIDAVERAQATGRYVAAHTDLHYLDDAATETLIASGKPGPSREETHHRTWFGAFALPRALYDRVGGYDERFGEWGRHSLAFWHACRTLSGLDRVPGTAFHLWHPERPYITTPAAEALYDRYTDADHDPAKMAALVNEAR